MNFPTSLQNLINAFAKLPGVGPKSAERLGFFMLKEDDENIKKFSSALVELKENIKFCEKCFNIDENSPCSICEDSRRDSSIICVVETPMDLIAIEKSGVFKGLYHVLHGVLSPIDGIGPDDLKIDGLISRLKELKPKEVILALNPSMEGEATNSFIINQIKKLELEISISKIAQGLPTGANIEYADNLTLQNAIEGRFKY